MGKVDTGRLRAVLEQGAVWTLLLSLPAAKRRVWCPYSLRLLCQINSRDYKDIRAEQHHHGTFFFLILRFLARYNKNKYEMASYSKHELMLGLRLISKEQLNRL